MFVRRLHRLQAAAAGKTQKTDRIPQDREWSNQVIREYPASRGTEASGVEYFFRVIQ